MRLVECGKITWPFKVARFTPRNAHKGILRTHEGATVPLNNNGIKTYNLEYFCVYYILAGLKRF